MNYIVRKKETVQLVLCIYGKQIRTLSVSQVNNQRIKMNNQNFYNNGTSRVRSSDPGIGRRLKILRENDPDLEHTVVHDENLEELEGDFMNSTEIKRFHERQMRLLNHRTELKITEQKHFKIPVEPNLLTWSEKEQIRHLHSENPQEWNITKLAESFPATPNIIKKILKSSWKPNSEDYLRKHDEAVARNWRKWDDGELQVNCPVLREHLKKFTKRTFLDQSSTVRSEICERFLPKPQGSEFVNIINSYKLLENLSENNDINNNEEASELKNNSTEWSTLKTNKSVVTVSDDNNNKKTKTSIPGMSTIKKSTYTLQELRQVMDKKVENMNINDVQIQDRALLNASPSPNTGIVNKINDTMEMDLKKIDDAECRSENNKMQTAKNNSISNLPVGANTYNSSTELFVSKIPRRIHIPKHKVHVGYLYKVKDCFYSHDGFFLYRVPGMSDSNNSS